MRRLKGLPARPPGALNKRRRVNKLSDFVVRLCAAAVSLLLGRIGRWSGREIARSALSLAPSAQTLRLTPQAPRAGLEAINDRCRQCGDNASEIPTSVSPRRRAIGFHSLVI
ncbi:hypothetical protein EVAR_2866_1 [Eumeta japonica]|uniref:Uncharacterized protein n=1 Tax=Eumeta variegata TaxID=151549 RepID=A0A4C1T0N7_EUMVA|nr:hypothetical protein EVAR_2866_1 [Eumeta japonica]